MFNYNHITLIGIIGKDAETKNLEEKTLIKFSVGVNVSHKKGNEWMNETQWFNVQMWAKNTTQAQILTKGQQVFVEGQMRSLSYEKSGAKSVFWFVQADSVQVQPQKAESESGASKKESPAPKKESQPAVKKESTKDDIPF